MTTIFSARFVNQAHANAMNHLPPSLYCFAALANLALVAFCLALVISDMRRK